MRPFSLKEYLKNPSLKVVTRDGRNVRIICTDAKGNFPIIALVETPNNTEVALRLSEDGYFYSNGEDSRNLFFATEKQERWVNIYKDKENYYPGRYFSSTKEEAVNLICIDAKYITTVKVEWEE